MRRFGILMAAIWSLTAAAPAASNETSFWGETLGWKVLVDFTNGGGCYAIKPNGQGTLVRVGLSPRSDRFHFIIGDEAWRSLENGRTYPLALSFDGGEPWRLEHQAVTLGGVTVLAATIEDFTFTRRFAHSDELRLSYEGREIAKMPLDGAGEAFGEIAACQAAVAEALTEAEPEFAALDDPFAVSQ